MISRRCRKRKGAADAPRRVLPIWVGDVTSWMPLLALMRLNPRRGSRIRGEEEIWALINLHGPFLLTRFGRYIHHWEDAACDLLFGFMDEILFALLSGIEALALATVVTTYQLPWCAAMTLFVALIMANIRWSLLYCMPRTENPAVSLPKQMDGWNPCWGNKIGAQACRDQSWRRAPTGPFLAGLWV